MTPILVPTLAELAIELDRAAGALLMATAAFRRDPEADDVQNEVAHAARQVFEVAAQIASLPACSIADLRVKARALKHLFSAVPSSWPNGREQQLLCSQLVDGLIDERVV